MSEIDRNKIIEGDCLMCITLLNKLTTAEAERDALQKIHDEAVRECNCPGAFSDRYTLPGVVRNLVRDKHAAEDKGDAARDFIAQIVIVVHNHKAWTEAPALHDLCEQVLALTEEAGVRTKPTPGLGAGT